MRHAALIVALLIACYVGWQISNNRKRRAIRAFFGRHTWPVLLIVGVTAAMLIAAAYINAPSII